MRNYCKKKKMLIQKKLTQHPLKKTTINNDSEYVTFSNIKEIINIIERINEYISEITKNENSNS